MITEHSRTIWVFIGEGGAFPSGIFSNRASAQEWIIRHSLSGILTEYPIDTGVFDWAIKRGSFLPKRPEQSTPKFIGRFTCASLEHIHFENGKYTQ
jgi:hypothetical protein